MTLSTKFLYLVTIKTLLVSLIISFPNAQGENILFYWGFSGYSHRISVWPLIEKLIEKGHNVTFLSPHPSKTPDPNSKVIEFIPKNLLKAIGLHDINFLDVRFQQGVDGIDNLWSTYPEVGIRGCEAVFSNPEVLEWVNKTSFDLVVVNFLFNECAFALAHKFNAPHIIYSTTGHMQWWTEGFGHPHENYLDLQYHFQVDMTFAQRVKTELNVLFWHFKRSWNDLPRMDGFLREALQMPDMPSLLELEQNTSLVFVNNHFSEEFARALPPMFVQIGGIHCRDERKPLAKDIQEFIDSSVDDGFILLSFGSSADLSILPEYLQNIFHTVMKKLKIKFLIVHKDADSKKFPDNVKASKWISQQDVMAHPKIRAFITHGGRHGTQEAIYHGVPQIVFPLFAEQDFNAEIIKAQGTGIVLEITKLTEEILEGAINEVLSNKKYGENSKKLSRKFKDRRDKPVDTAVWWVEYVLRNRDDTSHLRPILKQKQTWYQRRQLDVWGFLALAGVLILGLIASGIRFIFTKFLKIKYSKTEDGAVKAKKVQ